MAIDMMIIPAALIWGGVYLVFDEPFAALFPLLYMAVSVVGVVTFAFTRRDYLFRFSHLLAILPVPFLLMVALGGFVNEGAVILWSLLSPLGAMTFAGPWQPVGWFLGFLALLVVSSAIEPFAPSGNNLPAAVAIAFFAMNIGAVSTLVFVLLQDFIKQLEQERKKSDRLLLNVLPREVAVILKEGDRTIADYFEEVSVLIRRYRAVHRSGRPGDSHGAGGYPQRGILIL